MARNPMPQCASTVEEIIEMYHPRVQGYFVDVTGLIGFRTAKTVYRKEYSGSPHRVRSRVQTIVWYGFDGDAGCFVRVGASKAAGAWAQYHRLSRRRRR